TKACRESIRDVHIIPRKHLLAFACKEGSAGVADYALALSIRERFSTQGTPSRIYSSEDGDLAIVLTNSSVVHVHDIETQLTYHYKSQVNVVCAGGPTSRYRGILTGDINGSIRSWDIPSRAAHIAIQGDSAILRATLSPKGDYLAAGAADGTVF